MASNIPPRRQRPAKHDTRRRDRFRLQLRLEDLEGRLMLSAGGTTVVVNTAADAASDPAGTVSLRDALNLADADPGVPHVITFDPSLSGQTISLGDAGLFVGDDLTIVGPSDGSAPVVVTGAGVEVGAGRNVAISGVTLAGGLTVDGVAGGGTVGVSGTGVTQGGHGVTFSGVKVLRVNAAGNPVAVAGLVAGGVTTVDGGPVDVNLAGDFAGELDLADVATATVAVGGDFGGVLSAPASTTVSRLTVNGSVLATASISAGDFPAVAVGKDFAGSLDALADANVPGSAVVGAMTVGLAGGGNVSGKVVANEARVTMTATGPSGGLVTYTAPVAGTGIIHTFTVLGDLTGLVEAGHIGTLKVGGDLTRLAQVYAHGSGTIDDITVSGDLSGQVDAPEDATPITNLPDTSTGIIGDITVGGDLEETDILADDATYVPNIDTGQIGTVTVDGDLGGTIMAQGAGKIGTVVIKGDIRRAGSITADDLHDPALGTINALTVGGNVGGTINAPVSIGTARVGTLGQGVTLATGSVHTFVANAIAPTATLAVSGRIDNASIATLAGTFRAGTLGAGGGKVSVGRMAAGSSLRADRTQGVVTLDGVAGSTRLGTLAAGTRVNLGDVTSPLEYDSVPPGAVIRADSIASLTIDHGVQGTIEVTHTLGVLRIGTSIAPGAQISAGRIGALTVGSPGPLVAPALGPVAAYGGYGPVVLRVDPTGVSVQTARFRHVYGPGSAMNAVPDVLAMSAGRRGFLRRTSR